MKNGKARFNSDPSQLILDDGLSSSSLSLDWKRLALICGTIFFGVFIFFLPNNSFVSSHRLGSMSLATKTPLPPTDYFMQEKPQERIEKLTDAEVKEIEQEELEEASKLPIGTGGAQVLFLPCKVDGFWSNVRQLIGAVYLARVYNLTYVEQEFYFKFQDSGRISGVDGPILMFDLFDQEFMSRYLRTMRLDAYFDYQKPSESSVSDSIKTIGVDKGLRCEIAMNRANVDRNFRRWIRRYGISKAGFIQNRYRTRAAQKEMMAELSWLPPDRKFVIAGTPRFTEVLKDYPITPHYQFKEDIPEFWRLSFESLRFSKPIVALYEKAKKLLGIHEGDKFISVHIRRGATYALGGKSGQAKTDDVVDAVHRSLKCIGVSTVKAIFVSTVRPYLARETTNLQKAFPNIKIVSIGAGNVTWSDLAPGMGARNTTIMRAGVEMKFWNEADAFIGSRSTMSSFVHLMRLARIENGVDACNRFAQKAWYDSYKKLPGTAP